MMMMILILMMMMMMMMMMNDGDDDSGDSDDGGDGDNDDERAAFGSTVSSLIIHWASVVDLAPDTSPLVSLTQRKHVSTRPSPSLSHRSRHTRRPERNTCLCRSGKQCAPRRFCCMCQACSRVHRKQPSTVCFGRPANCQPVTVTNHQQPPWRCLLPGSVAWSHVSVHL